MKLLPIRLLLVPLLVAAFSAGAAPGALEINQDCVAVGCFSGDDAGYPVTITQSGSYILTSDLAPPGDTNTNAVEITTSAPVDIDLDGHAIDGGGGCDGNPSVTSCSGATGKNGFLLDIAHAAHIHNGTIRGFYISGIVIKGAGGDATVLDHLTVTLNQGSGVYVESDVIRRTVRIRDSQIVRNGSSGVTALNIVFVENSSIAGNFLEGIVDPYAGSVFVGNRFSNNGGTGITCGNCALGQNTFAGNNGGDAAVQFTVSALSDMGGNVCLDHASGACP